MMTFLRDCYHQIVRPGGHLQKFANGLDMELDLNQGATSGRRAQYPKRKDEFC
jgi:hypothetical protein